ncbi:MAG: GntR family transcriptional regulator [Anaerolineae bacterium]|nr:GntR family transcriptional regulator [Anaerolineae bacterium]
MTGMFKLSKTSSLPLHTQLLNELRHAILSGRLKPHDRLPGEFELVEQLGISRTTIQKAWDAAEDEGLIYRVPAKGTYVAAPQQGQQVSRSVGFLVPQFLYTFDGDLLDGAEKVLRQHGYRLLFAQTERRVEEENRLLHTMCQEGVVGFLLWPVSDPEEKRILSGENCRVPIVLLDRPIPGVALPCVTSRNYEGGMQIMTHLLELGHRRIAFLAWPHLNLWPIAERFRAYQDAMRGAGLEPMAEPLYIGVPSSEATNYRRLAQSAQEDVQRLTILLSQPDRPTALFAMNDLVAMLALQAARRAGVRVPEDLSIAGFDNLEMTEHVTPPLTTVAQDVRLMGAEAARRLLALIAGEPVQDVFTLLPTRLIVRESTGPAPKGGV